MKLERSASGRSPTPQERVARIKQLRQEIDRLPDIELQTTLLFLGSEAGAASTLGGPELVSVDELVEACKQLGRERLLQLLRGEALTDDPDFHARCDNVWRARLFILRHAAVLLTKEDAPTLLRLDEEMTARRRERHAPSPTALWRIAAAQLDPDLGREPLRSAFTLVPNDNSERAEIIFAIWQIYAESEATFALDRFFPSELMCQESLLRRAEAASDRELLRRIIADERFDALDGRAVRITLRILNRFVGEPLVPENELERDDLPLPDNWRQVVRDSMPRWSS